MSAPDAPDVLAVPVPAEAVPGLALLLAGIAVVVTARTRGTEPSVPVE